MKEMKQYTIAEICSRLSSGKGIPASKVTPTGPYPVIGGNGVRGYTDSFNFDGECAIIGRQGANCGNVRYFQGKAYMTEHAIVAIGNENANTKYLACLFSLMHLGNLSAQSAQPGLSVQTLSKQIIYLPEISTQNQIADIIKSLDTKIELNNRINHNLEEQAQALYKSWFIDFEPFKDGKFVESELGMIPEGWQCVNLTEISSIFDSLRKPLSGMQRESMKKLYPYYGATEVMDYVDNYIFDGIYLLMGEDGSVIKPNGDPFLQYVEGKFWPNNHAHVLQGANGYSTEMLHCALLHTNITHAVTGAVQAKISQANMKKILFALPPDNICYAFDSIIQSIYKSKRTIEKENNTLRVQRETILPRLLSGEITC